jgi:isoleucyl-tRNA synthetase
MAEDAWLHLPYPRPGPSVFSAGWPVPPAQWSALPVQDAALWAVVLELRGAANAVLERARSAKAIGPALEAKVREGRAAAALWRAVRLRDCPAHSRARHSRLAPRMRGRRACLCLVLPLNDLLLVLALLGRQVVLHISDPGMAARVAGLQAGGNGVDDLRFLLITSAAELAPSAEAVRLCPFHDTLASSSGAGEISVGVARADGAKCARCWNFSPAVGSGREPYTDLCERCKPVVTALGVVPASAQAAKEPAVAR